MTTLIANSKTKIAHTATAAAILIALVVAGCKKEEFGLAPVSGTVTLDGEPLGNARVGFEPMAERSDHRAGPGSYATTDNQGHYQLESLHGTQGAVVGQHRVAIHLDGARSKSDDEMDLASSNGLPARYNSESELTIEVPESGTDQADFNLTSN